MTSSVLERDTALAPSRTVRKVRHTLGRLAVVAAAALLTAGIAAYGYRWWSETRFHETTDDAYVGGNVTTIAPHVPGFIQRILATDNELVRAGQPLIELDPRDYQAALGHAQAVSDQREAALASLDAQTKLQSTRIAEAQAELASRIAEAQFAAQEEQRYAALAQTAAGSRQEQQRTASAAQAARSAVLSATAALAAARQQLAVLGAQIAQARAAVAEANSDLQTARLNLGYTEIRAPVDGYVGNRAAQVGAYVAAGAYLLSVIPASGLWVDANFKEDQLAGMRGGEKATLIADIAPGRVFHGHLLSIAPGTGAIFSVIPPENATGNFTKIVQRVPVRIALDAGDSALGLLRPGLSATVSVETRAP